MGEGAGWRTSDSCRPERPFPPLGPCEGEGEEVGRHRRDWGSGRSPRPPRPCLEPPGPKVVVKSSKGFRGRGGRRTRSLLGRPRVFGSTPNSKVNVSGVTLDKPATSNLFVSKGTTFSEKKKKKIKSSHFCRGVRDSLCKYDKVCGRKGDRGSFASTNVRYFPQCGVPVRL